MDIPSSYVKIVSYILFRVLRAALVTGALSRLRLKSSESRT